MAKMISKFHLLIQSKMLWVVFVGLIVISFVLLPVAANLSGRGQRAESAPGEIDGKPVPHEEYQMARMHTNLNLMLMMLMQGRELEYNERVRDFIDEEAWRRLITLRRARQLGFDAHDSEIARYIRDFPVFQQEGSFSPQMYDSFRQFYLVPRGYSPSDFERYIAEEVILQKMERMLTAATVVPVEQLDRTIEMMTTEYRLKYILLADEDFDGEVEVSEQDARLVYEDSPELFRVPERIHLKYVYFPYDEFMEEVGTPSEEELENYYNRNISDFRYAEDTVDSEDDEESSSYKPFEDVRLEIENILRIAEARHLATDAANEMVFELPPDRSGRAPSFAEVAEKMGREVRSLEPFRVDELPNLADSPQSVLRNADRLRPNPDEYFSDAVPADEGVYVLALIERSDAYIPDFEMVRDPALEVAADIAREEAVMEAARHKNDRLQAMIAEGASFAEASEALEMSYEKTEVFRLQEAAYALPEPLKMANLPRQIAFLNQGEFIRPTRLRDGVLLAYVAQREIEEDVSMQMMRGMIFENLLSDNAATMLQHWQDDLLESAGFVDRNRRDR